MRKLMQEPARLHSIQLNDHISIPSSAGRRHDVLIKRKRDEADDDQHVHHRAHRSHGLGYLSPVHFRHVPAHQAGLHERRAQPPYHGVRRREGNAAERQRRDERLAIAAEGVGKDANRGEEDGEQAERFREGQVGRDRGRRDGISYYHCCDWE